METKTCCYCGVRSTDKMYVTMYGGGADKVSRVYNCTGVINCLSRIRAEGDKVNNKLGLSAADLTQLTKRLNKVVTDMDDKINITPAVNGNSLRDEVKDAVRNAVQAYDTITFDSGNDIACDVADAVFDLLHIDEDKQDMNYEEYMTT